MPNWTPPRNPYSSSFMEPQVLPTVKVETRGASAYEQEQMGQHSETSNPVPINRGEIETTQKGDHLQQYQTVVTATETTEQLVTLTDFGAGSNNLAQAVTVQVEGESYDVVTNIPQFGVNGQLETAQQGDSTFLQPETAPPPVYWEPLPVEQQAVDETQYVPLGNGIGAWNEETQLFEPYLDPNVAWPW